MFNRFDAWAATRLDLLPFEEVIPFNIIGSQF